MVREVGVHLLLELGQCPSESLTNADLILQSLNEAAEKAGSELLQLSHHQFENNAVTAVALLAESHMSVHTWPEYQYAAVDLFFCGERADADAACAHLVECLGAGAHSLRKFSRGIPSFFSISEPQASLPNIDRSESLAANEAVAASYVKPEGTVLWRRQSDVHDAMILETPNGEKQLYLDGVCQSSTRDEFLYHEPLVHIPMLHHGAPKKVLVLGGAEGATIREVLRWKSVERVVMCDIDEDLVLASREYLPELHQLAFDDPRVELMFDDAFNLIRDVEPGWDVIIADLTDPLEETPCQKLYTREFYEMCSSKLNDGGVYNVQGGPFQPGKARLHARLVSTQAKVFDSVTSFGSFVPSYITVLSFVMGKKGGRKMIPSAEEIDRMLEDQLVSPLKMLDGTAALGATLIPKYIRELIEADEGYFTLAAPPAVDQVGIPLFN